MGLAITKKSKEPKYDFQLIWDSVKGVLTAEGYTKLAGKRITLVIDGDDVEVYFDSNGQAEITFDQSNGWHNVRLKLKGAFANDQRISFFY